MTKLGTLIKKWYQLHCVLSDLPTKFWESLYSKSKGSWIKEKSDIFPSIETRVIYYCLALRKHWKLYAISLRASATSECLCRKMVMSSITCSDVLQYKVTIKYEIWRNTGINKMNDNAFPFAARSILYNSSYFVIATLSYYE